MKEFEENAVEGWTIYPQEHAQRALRWIKKIESLTRPSAQSGSSKTPRDTGSKTNASLTGVNALPEDA